jgi:hypothetical protein
LESIGPITGRFIAAIWRRMVWIRIAESVGISLAVASVTGLILTPIMWWRGVDPFSAIAALWGPGFVVGILWGISRRPSLMEAAVEADHQLDLHDLLGTMLRTDTAADAVWGESLAAFAEERCRGLRASAVIVNKIGLRGWAGVGILGLLVMAVGMLTSRPSEVTAAPTGLAAGWEGLGEQKANENSIGLAKAVDRPPGPGGVDDLGRRMAMGLNEGSSQQGGAGMDSSRNVGAGAGSGAGKATTPAGANTVAPDRRVALNAASSRFGEAADGTGTSDTKTKMPGENHSNFASSVAGRNAAPWSASGWGNDRTAAESAIQAGEVADGDADLVRDYFRRD